MSWTSADLIAKRKALWAGSQSVKQDHEFRLAVGDYLVSEKGAGLRKEIAADPEILIELVMVIVDKKAETVPFFLNDVQRDLQERLRTDYELYKKGKLAHLRYLLLKGRQQGFTSYVTARQLSYTLVKMNYNGLTLADNTDSTEAIFNAKAKYPYDQLPLQLKPSERYNTRREMYFNKLNSKWRVATAGAATVARGQTLTFLHGSEIGYWPDMEKVVMDVNPAMSAGTFVIFESTANGRNEYYDAWRGGSYHNLFFEWWRTSEYKQVCSSVEEEAEFIERVDLGTTWIWERLRFLRDEINLRIDQLYWYYQQWLVYDENVKQEYPCSAEEAFLASGRPVFSSETLQQRKMVLELRDKKGGRYKEGIFELTYDDPETRNAVKAIGFREVEGGWIRLYEAPKHGRPYVLGGDTKGEGSDYFAASVRDNTTGTQVATLHGHMDDPTYAHQIYALGRYFGFALIGVEINFNTYPVRELQRLRYPKLAMRQIYDTTKGIYENRIGFRTDGQTRPVMISNMQDWAKHHSGTFNDMHQLEEMMAFAYDKNGRPDAPSGQHDDLLFADMICLEIRPQQGKVETDKPLDGRQKLIDQLQDAKSKKKTKRRG